MDDQNTSQGSGLSPNIAAFLCYICMPVTSIVFLLVERENKDVRFHALQGTILGAGSMLIILLLEIISNLIGSFASFFGIIIVGLLVPIYILLAIIIWIICLVKAYQGEQWRIPYVGNFAARKVGLPT